MELTQRDYDERKQRIENGEGTDEDARLVAHYETEGYEWAGNSSQRSSETTPSSPERTETNPPSSAPTTGNPSKTSEADDSTAAPTGGAGRKADPSTRSESVKPRR